MADPIRIASFFTGTGMLDEGVRAGLKWLGYRTRSACLCEWDAYASDVLLARMADESLEPAPVFCGDLRDFDGRRWAGAVDLIAAGPPCQPFSCAGRQQGNSDSRAWGDGDGPIFHFCRIIGEMRPALVFIENVPAFVTAGHFRSVGEELSRLGYEIESPLWLAAADVGASHLRERVFVLAHCMRSGRQQESRGAPADEGKHAGRTTNGNHFASGDGADMGHAERDGQRISGWSASKRTHKGRKGILFAPGRNDPRWADILNRWPHLAPAVEPGFRQLVDGESLVVDASRADQLRCVGNGCVAAQAAVAIVVLAGGVLL